MIARAENGKLYSFPSYLPTGKGYTVVADWKDGLSTIVTKGVELNDPFIEQVRVITHGCDARVITFRNGKVSGRRMQTIGRR